MLNTFLFSVTYKPAYIQHASSSVSISVSEVTAKSGQVSRQWWWPQVCHKRLFRLVNSVVQNLLSNLENGEHLNYMYGRIVDCVVICCHQVQVPVVQTLDSAIHWINHYPADNAHVSCNTYPLVVDSDLSSG